MLEEVVGRRPQRLLAPGPSTARLRRSAQDDVFSGRKSELRTRKLARSPCSKERLQKCSVGELRALAETDHDQLTRRDHIKSLPGGTDRGNQIVWGGVTKAAVAPLLPIPFFLE